MVADFQISQLRALRVRCERGKYVPVNVGEPQLGAWVGALPPDDDDSRSDRASPPRMRVVARSRRI